ncbi:hypothetical protein [Leptolyngbya sp. KIOST-1]|uniref:hypothetical protein n=1 Tax=Leptolyngbya sp. KIOST-1 TaxID=1229172 RepID=UPI0005633292|nr:hypothetical protein [Leptolyngbya sp. KIOST-1]
MVNSFDSVTNFQLSVKSPEHELDPRVTHNDVQTLQSSLAQLSGLEHSEFEFIPRSQRPTGLGRAPTNGAEPDLYIGFRMAAPLPQFRTVLRCVGNWLDRTTQRYSFDIALTPAHTITLHADQARVLAQVIPLGEALLPPHELYLAKAASYVDTFGELTPAARANLLLLRHRLELSTEETNDLNSKAMGPFKTLGEKYQHFRRELLACQQESDLDSEFWQVMQAKADTMSLPEADAQFLKAERLGALRQEAERERQRLEAEAETERQRYREQQQRLSNYRQQFEALLIDALVPLEGAADVAQFRQAVLAQLFGPEFNQGRLTQARTFYNLSPQEADALEKRVLDELYLLSRLL